MKEGGQNMKIEVSEFLKKKVLETAENMLVLGENFSEVPETDGMILVKKGTPEAEKHISGAIEEFPVGDSIFVLCHK